MNFDQVTNLHLTDADFGWLRHIPSTHAVSFEILEVIIVVNPLKGRGVNWLHFAIHA